MTSQNTGRKIDQFFHALFHTNGKKDWFTFGLIAVTLIAVPIPFVGLFIAIALAWLVKSIRNPGAFSPSSHTAEGGKRGEREQLYLPSAKQQLPPSNH